MSSISMESKVSKNFLIHHLLRDSQRGNIIDKELTAAAVPPTPPMALPADVGTSKSSMALAGSVKQQQPPQQMMVPMPTIGNFFVPFTPSPMASMPFPVLPKSSSSSSNLRMPMSMAAFLSPPFLAPASSPATESELMPQNFPGQPQQETLRIRKEMPPNGGRGNGIGPQNAVLKCHIVKAKCNICAKAFGRPWLLNLHRRRVHSIYVCNHCGKAFKLRSYLGKHVRANACRQ